MRFAPIVPINYMPILSSRKHYQYNMLLAHMLSENSRYAETAKNEVRSVKVLDNSFFELGYALENSEVVAKAKMINADGIVLKDGIIDGADDILLQLRRVYLVPTTFEQMINFAREVVELGDAEENTLFFCLSHIHCAKIINKKPFSVKNRVAVLDKLLQHFSGIEASILAKHTHFLGFGDNPADEIEEIRTRLGNDFYADSSLFLSPFIQSGGKIKFEHLGLKSKAEKIDFYYELDNSIYAAAIDELNRLTEKYL